MTYNVSLYNRDFLRRAIAEQSGDWTNADPLPVALVEKAITICSKAGFVAEPHPPGFEEFMRQTGATPSRDFKLVTSSVCARMSIFPNSISFEAEYSTIALASVEFCTDFARRLAQDLALGYYDGQAGEVIV